jgi:hypothetical protein
VNKSEDLLKGIYIPMVKKQKRNICKQHTILNSTSDYPTRNLLQKNVDPVNRNEGGLAGLMKEIRHTFFAAALSPVGRTYLNIQETSKVRTCYTNSIAD